MHRPSDRAKGAYSAAIGPTRTDAIATAKANAPWATAVQPFCSWDGNDVPETFIPAAAPTESIPSPRPQLGGAAYIRRLDALGIPHYGDDAAAIRAGNALCQEFADGLGYDGVASKLIADNDALANGDQQAAHATADAIIYAAIDTLCPEERGAANH